MRLPVYGVLLQRCVSNYFLNSTPYLQRVFLNTLSWPTIFKNIPNIIKIISQSPGVHASFVRLLFLEWQPCHSSEKGYGFHQINHTIE